MQCLCSFCCAQVSSVNPLFQYLTSYVAKLWGSMWILPVTRPYSLRLDHDSKDWSEVTTSQVTQRYAGSHQKEGEARDRLCFRAFKGAYPVDMLTSDFRSVRALMSVVSSHLVCDTWLWQSCDSDTWALLSGDLCRMLNEELWYVAHVGSEK